MGKKSILNEATETMVEAAKAGVAVAKMAATAGLAAAGPAAAGVVLESVSKGLQSAEQKVESVRPGKAAEAFGVTSPSPLKKTTRRKAPVNQAKRAAGKKKSRGRKGPSKQKKGAVRKTRTVNKQTAPKKKTMRKQTSATKLAKTKRGKSRRKR